MSEKGIDWSSLWKKDEWLAVWLGFLIIILILAGMTVNIPRFKWTTDGEFSTLATSFAPAVEKMAKAAEEKGEPALQEAASGLQAAIKAGDRKAIGAAAKKVGDLAKAVKDDGLKKDIAKVAPTITGEAGNLASGVFTSQNILRIVYIGIGLLILGMIGIGLMGVPVGKFIVGFPVVFIFAAVAQFVAGNYTILSYGLEYVIWCLILGLVVSNVFGTPEWLKAAAKTEFYIKTGLVILGAGILFGEIVQAGAYGIVQAVLVVAVVWYLCYWIARKFQVDEEFSAILASGVSICGVSAAIATSGAVKGDPKKLSYVTSLVLVCAVPMMILQPAISKALGIPDIVAGAWLGGTLDTSGSVVAAGALISETAMKTGVIVKMSQNVLIGVAAFILAIWWTFRKGSAVPGAEKPGAIEIWYRFPKFVLGFIVASILFSFIIDPKTVNATKGVLAGLRTWWFALAFVSIGLETRFVDLAKMGGGRPVAAFLIAQIFNIFWTLLLAYLIFGGLIVGAPKL
jgi:uncharacterized integral membrane protein (TIGR00698 family)